LWERENVDENADQCTPTLRQLWEGTRRTISAMLPVVLTLRGTPLPSETIIDASKAFRRRRTGRSPGCATCRPGPSVPSDLIAEAKNDHGPPRWGDQVGTIWLTPAPTSRITGSDRPSSSQGLAGLRLRAQGLRPLGARPWPWPLASFCGRTDHSRSSWPHASPAQPGEAPAPRTLRSCPRL